MVFANSISRPFVINDMGEGTNSSSKLKEKVVFLTFDDGPTTTNTRKILDILKNNKVKASFFVVGNNVKLNMARGNGEILKEAYNYGVDIYPHSESHVYNKIYRSEAEYIKDLEFCENTINNSLNSNKFNRFLRMPGGSNNRNASHTIISNIRKMIKAKGISYIDWNVSTGDASSKKCSKENIIKNIESHGDVYNISVVLIHDAYGKESSVDALQGIIDYYKARGYKFKSLGEMNDVEYNYLVKAKVINAN
ncbi:Peptidoglycan/xylan/chitin deacetylase, PgdA/CDA1 family [Clostridium cavendishii DSM 21758]|uniref:Peptidoglycan/xylan/chitin deacetylase, PgdA/CDA1 family n=1 Tax=Clostridium cavendishii DSM 21758 TaxID=1121302 RepID=A0A1M6RYB9_9CLOT|nr:polysaccharide deacetylase family protein [Clostridium cavendishii]SHK37451.1 Peptidoglycan/xylan/chitin deacetylase, PgdA/CDA1 family [Clostridium cavendishii DSM 21758]